MPSVSVASFNIHAGTDGWGRPYDLIGACRELDAEVIVLQEVFAPLEGPSQAEAVAADLGFDCVELPLARAWRRRVPLWEGKGWEPRRPIPRRDKSLRVGGKLSGAAAGEAASHEEGTWGLAVLSRHEITGSEAIELGRLRRDFTRRAALVVELDVLGSAESHAFNVIGMHGSHVTAGSPLQFRRLQGALADHSGPAALVGDMNLWGPPLSLLFPGWKRAVKGRTWPAWRPHSQTDHILVRAGTDIVAGRVVYAGNSDHRAVRAELTWRSG
jgi:endonuclease/exonuclease/phosphatase family metal-dependent hydrolase